MIPPAGMPIPIKVLVRGLWASLNPKTAGRFQKALRDYLGVRHIFFLSSGRGALTLILRAFAQQSRRNEVLIPAYTCFSVPSAIVKAGLKIRLCDIDMNTLDFDYSALEKMDWGNVLCISPSNLFGLVSNLPEITRIAKRHGAFVIDDAAQSLGASLSGIKSGTMGDVGLFSLGRGKVISTYEGGVVVTHSDGIAEELSREPYVEVKRQSISIMFLKLLGYSIFLQPRLYGIPHRMPFLEIGASKFDPNFIIDGFSRFQIAIGSLLLRELDALNEQRREIAEILTQGLMEKHGLMMPRSLKASYPIFLRFPFLAMNQELRERIYTDLLLKGIGVTKMYPTGIHRITGIGPYLVNGQEKFPQTDLISSSILTLPTHPLLTGKDLATMIEVINRCLRN
jgi:dTDP-4-amino-4,6-dideoxygalactose transaminase